MNLLDDIVEFRAWPEYWNAVNDGRKTAEVRVMTDREWRAFRAADPMTIVLKRSTDGESLSRCIAYVASVAQILGNHIVLICMYPGQVRNV